MKHRLTTILATTAFVLGGTVALAGPAAADHCEDNGGPGNSDFAAHVKANNGPGGHNEGDHKGWSDCEENSANYQTGG